MKKLDLIENELAIKELGISQDSGTVEYTNYTSNIDLNPKQQTIQTTKRLRTYIYELDYISAYAQSLLNQGFPKDSSIEDMLQLSRNIGISRNGIYEQYVQSNLEKRYAEAAPFEAFAAQKQRRNMFPLMNAKGPEIISVLAQVNASNNVSTTADV
ncbi:Hypothetical_protein [Hexamita inflata]|uniref:Hypothetical_protein n=1 Tax=Hexamita inflata TaxID=28002 RepID=A0AA86RFF5_9EUKA|nr:Hypothetical protein HINF_LOCUS63117 [Hexamita inflata]